MYTEEISRYGPMPVAMDTMHKGVAEERYKLGALIEDLWDWTLYLQTGEEHLTITISFMKEVHLITPETCFP